MEIYDIEQDIQDAKDIDFWFCEEQKLCDWQYHIVFAHPESFISRKYGRDLLLSKKYTENVVAIVVDEAHCILDWLGYNKFISTLYIIFQGMLVKLISDCHHFAFGSVERSVKSRSDSGLIFEQLLLICNNFHLVYNYD